MTYRQLSPSYYRQRVPTTRWWGRLLYWALGPVGLIGIISLVVLVINFYFTYRVRPYDSDDVIMQNALLYWKPFDHITYFADAGASYIDRIPLYWLVGRVISPGRHALFVDGIILAVGNFALFYWSTIYLLKKAGLRLTYLTLLPILWLSSFGYVVAELFVATSMHNVEVGVILATCALITKIYYGEFHPLASPKALFLTILCALVLGCTVVGDRYVVYYGLLPILVYAAVGFLYKQRSVIRKRIGILSGVIVLAFVFAAIIQLILAKSGVDFMSGVGARTPQFVTYNLFFTNVEGTIYNLFIVFGADFWGGNVVSVATIGAILNGVLLFLTLRAAILYFRPATIERSKTDRGMPIQLMAILFLWCIFILTISSLGGNGTYHYFVLLPFVGVLLLINFLATTHGAKLRLAAILLLVATVLNFGVNYYNAMVPSSISSNVFSGLDQANGRDNDIAHILEAHGLTDDAKGYSNYWQANITSYLSGGKLDILPVLCSDSGQTVVYKWLMTSSQLTRPVAKTFFLFDTSYQDAPNCPTSDVNTQYGAPAQVFNADGTIVYVYNRNITAPLQTGDV